MDNREYRKCVAIFVKQKGTDFVFLAERINEVGAWQIPQGGVNKNESDYDAAVRELKEETGIHSVKYLGCTKKRYNYDFPPYIIEKMKSRGDDRIKYKGQCVKFFLFEFIGDDSEINLEYYPEEIEFSHWKWEHIEKATEKTAEFKKKATMNGAKELFPEYFNMIK